MITPLFIGYSCPLFIVHCTLIFFQYIPTRLIEAAWYSCSTPHVMYQYCLFVCCNFCGWLLYVSSPHNTNAIIFITWWSTTAFLNSMFVVFKQYDNVYVLAPYPWSVIEEQNTIHCVCVTIVASLQRRITAAITVVTIRITTQRGSFQRVVIHLTTLLEDVASSV